MPSLEIFLQGEATRTMICNILALQGISVLPWGKTLWSGMVGVFPPLHEKKKKNCCQNRIRKQRNLFKQSWGEGRGKKVSSGSFHYFPSLLVWSPFLLTTHSVWLEKPKRWLWFLRREKQVPWRSVEAGSTQNKVKGWWRSNLWSSTLILCR